MVAGRRKLFGTDGIRAVAGRFPLTPEMVQRIGMSLGVYLKAKRPDKEHTVLIGKDTRASSDMIESAIASGLTAVGVDVVRAGVLPTPGVSCIVKERGFSAGVAISASHNPPEYNGLKFFNENGKKFSEREEAGLELVIFGKYELPRVEGENVARVMAGEHYLDLYEKHLESNGRYLAGLKIGVDCANGATFQVAPKVLKSLGAKVYVFGAEPNGKNINIDCGSTHPEFIADKVKAYGLDMGFAFDGDGDRCIAVDEKGKVVDGDKIMALFALWYERKSREVVGTVMSNMGLEVFLRERGFNFHRTPVGDRFVAEKMEEVGAVVGGEPSGHVIVKELEETGDGIMTAVLIASIVKSERKPLSHLVSGVKLFPQKLKNVKVKEKPRIETLSNLSSAIRKCEKTLKGKGRVLVRYSGTEPFLRIMVEAEDANLIEPLIETIENGARRDGITAEP
jgi:phosphoglucosamine mutase